MINSGGKKVHVLKEDELKYHPKQKKGESASMSVTGDLWQKNGSKSEREGLEDSNETDGKANIETN